METYFNLAALQGGTFGTTNNDEERHRNDIPFSANWNVDNCSQTPENAFFIVNFLRLATVDTLVLRLYEKDNRTFTFHQFESSPDSVVWTEILSPGSTGKGAFKVTFDSPRLVSQIRIRGKSTAGPHLHVVRFQAFNMSGIDLTLPPVPVPIPGNETITVPEEIPPILPPVPIPGNETITVPEVIPPIPVPTYPSYQSTGISKLPGDPSRDAAWKVKSLPSVSNNGYDGIPLKAGENAYIYDGKSGYGNWNKAFSSSGWIGVTPNLMNARPQGDYEYETTFTMPSQYTSLEVKFSVDDSLKLLTVVSDNGATTQTIDTFGVTNGAKGFTTLIVTGLKGNTTMTFTAYNGSRSPHGFLVQFGEAFK